jgi:putative phosphonate metabolism protein
MTARYAVYLAPPPDSALWRFGSRVLGRDAASGEDVFGFAPSGFTASEWRDLTAEPRRYGFHATLKAPFRLSEGRTRRELEAAAAALAKAAPAFDLGPLQASAVRFAGGGFVALTPAEDSPALRALEARAVRELDAFRAPPNEAELARRRPERLTPRQRENLAAFGYPYVLDEFRPHFTLSGAVDDAEPLVRELARAFADSSAAPEFRVDALVLFTQEDGGPFRVSRRLPLE